MGDMEEPASSMLTVENAEATWIDELAFPPFQQTLFSS
jgi:hypothetical protein